MTKFSGVPQLVTFCLGACLVSGCESNSVSGYFAQNSSSSTSLLNGDGSSGTPPAGNGGTATTTITLKTIQPAFAVRGLNCMACHGVIGSNVVTDFGYGSANFSTMYTGLPGITNEGRTAFNDIESGWQNLVIAGSLHVPKVNFSQSSAMTDFGISGPTTMSESLQFALGGNATSMASGIKPLTGQAQIVEDTSISIKYPSQQEIIQLLPASLQDSAAAVYVLPLAGVTKAQQSGLGLDSSGSFVRNNSVVNCYGDVVIKGPLFLNNLNLVSDMNGCRLYVAGTVFIQGPITQVNGAQSNLQITSSSAILMGFSAIGMGAVTSPSQAGSSSTIRVQSQTNNNILTAGGPHNRFCVEFDNQYNPSGLAINGVASTRYFDGLVTDALSIGSELVDAGEPAAFNNLIAGESIVTESNENGDQGSYNGARVAINYSGVLFNAPHVHSRYGGTFSGVMISDVAMLARNPDNTAIIEQYTYDQRFNSVPAILPALTTTILDIQH